jgi:hypothetical protein
VHRHTLRAASFQQERPAAHLSLGHLRAPDFSRGDFVALRVRLAASTHGSAVRARYRHGARRVGRVAVNPERRRLAAREKRWTAAGARAHAG